MALSVFIPALAALANAALAALVWLKRPHAQVNRLFALTAFAAAGWAGTNALFQFTDSVGIATLTAQMSSVFSLVMSASFLQFSWRYPVHTPLNRVRLSVLWTVALLLCLLSLWPGAVDISVELSDTRRIVTGPGFYLVALFLLVTTLGAFTVFLRQTLALHGTLREQASYVLAGAGITAIFGLIFNLLFPLFGDYRFVWLGPSGSVFFVGGTVYSIIAHHLFDIRLIIKRAAVYSLIVALVGAGYSAAEYLLTELLKSLSPGTTPLLAIHIGGALIVSLCVNPLRKWLERRIHRLLHPKHHRKHWEHKAP